jgi:hypothetical protein
VWSVGEYVWGPDTGEGERRVVMVGWVDWRRISFWVESLWSSRFKRSFSDAMVVEWAARDDIFVSSSLTWRSLRSRKARWLWTAT